MTSKPRNLPSGGRGFRTPLPLFSRPSFRILRPLYMAIFWEMPGHAQDRTRHFDAPAPTVSKKKCQIPLFMFFGRKPGLTAFWVKIRGIGRTKKTRKSGLPKRGLKKRPFFSGWAFGNSRNFHFFSGNPRNPRNPRNWPNSEKFPEFPENDRFGAPRTNFGTPRWTPRSDPRQDPFLSKSGPPQDPATGPPDPVPDHQIPSQDRPRSRPRISQISPSHTSFRSLVSAG